jgi:hypothetical protein
MKRFFLALFIILLVINVCWAAKTALAKNSVTLSGIIIDNLSASAHKTDLKNYIHKYTKVNALMPNCQTSGYSLYSSDGNLAIFTKTSTRKIIKFLKGRINTISVEVQAKKTGTALDLVSIKNTK